MNKKIENFLVNNIERKLKNFEKKYTFKIPQKSAIAVKVKGINFEDVTKTLEKPFDDIFLSAMEMAMTSVADSIDTGIKAYTYSDEIIFFIGGDSDSKPYLENNIQKISSTIASSVTMAFYKSLLSFTLEYQEFLSAHLESGDIEEDSEELEVINKRISNLWEAINKDPKFEANCFKIPASEINNEIFYRQKECFYQAIRAYAETLFDKDELKGKTAEELSKMLNEKGKCIYDISDKHKFGLIYNYNEHSESILLSYNSRFSNDLKQ